MRKHYRFTININATVGAWGTGVKLKKVCFKEQSRQQKFEEKKNKRVSTTRGVARKNCWGVVRFPAAE